MRCDLEDGVVERRESGKGVKSWEMTEEMTENCGLQVGRQLGSVYQNRHRVMIWLW